MRGDGFLSPPRASLSEAETREYHASGLQPLTSIQIHNVDRIYLSAKSQTWRINARDTVAREDIKALSSSSIR
jgi:hypothetical protein